MLSLSIRIEKLKILLVLFNKSFLFVQFPAIQTADLIDKDNPRGYSARSLMLLQHFFAEMVKLVDTLASGASGRKLVEVQVLFSVPKFQQHPLVGLKSTGFHSIVSFFKIH